MSAITIRDLAHSRELDGQAMSTVRGGFVPGAIVSLNNVGNPVVTVNQSNTVVSLVEANIFNGNTISAPFSLDLKPVFAQEIATRNQANIAV